MSLNYSHDIATAVLAVSGAVLWILSRHMPEQSTGAAVQYFVGVFRRISRLGKISILYILAAGVPRVIFYMDYEWTDMAGDLQVIAIIIKHIVMFLLVGSGLYFWTGLNRKMKRLGYW